MVSEFPEHGIPQIVPRYYLPGSPWENGYIESFNGKIRDELFNVGDKCSLGSEHSGFAMSAIEPLSHSPPADMDCPQNASSLR